MNDSEEKREIGTLKLVVVMYLVVFIMKLIAYFLSGVMALLAEALHTLSDLFISGFLLIAVIWSRKGADEDHMFGHRRAQNVAALVAATLFISFTSFKLFEEAIPRLCHHEAVTYGNLGIAIGVLIASIIVAASPLIGLITQKKRGAAAKAQLLELINDELGLLAALLGTLFIAWGFPIADPIASLVVATIIALNAIGLFRENFSVLLGKSPGKAYIDNVVALGSSVQGVRDVHAVRAEYIGPDAVHVDLDVTVKNGMPVEEADEIAMRVRELIMSKTEAQFCSVHVHHQRNCDKPLPPRDDESLAPSENRESGGAPG
jgi:cation diffusion facilitator family transporter